MKTILIAQGHHIPVNYKTLIISFDPHALLKGVLDMEKIHCIWLKAYIHTGYCLETRFTPVDIGHGCSQANRHFTSRVLSDKVNCNYTNN